MWENFRAWCGLFSHMFMYELLHRMIELEAVRENVSSDFHNLHSGLEKKVVGSETKLLKGRVRMRIWSLD